MKMYENIANSWKSIDFGHKMSTKRVNRFKRFKSFELIETLQKAIESLNEWKNQLIVESFEIPENR